MVYDLHDLGSGPFCFWGTVRRSYRDTQYVQMYMYGGMKAGQQLGHVFRLYSNTTRAGLGTRLLARPGPVSCVWAAQDVPLCRPMGTTGTLAWPAPPGAPGQSGPWTPLQAQVRWHITRKVPSNELEDYRLKWSMQMINLIFKFMNRC